MYVFSILVAIALTVCKGDDDINPRIVGGEDAERGEFPWHVKLTYASKKINYFCGGSILDENNILTAAHCIMDVDQRKGFYQILAGVHKAVGKEPLQQPRFVKSVAVHPRYYIKPLTLLNDVAVMHLETPLVFTNTVQPVNLTDAAFDKVAMRSDRCLVHGLGVTYEKPKEKEADVMQKVSVNIIRESVCKAKSTKNRLRVNTKMHICSFTPGQSACYGDSGGAVGCYDKNNVFRQVGIVSFGPGHKLCRNGYSVDTRVSSYLEWIHANKI